MCDVCVCCVFVCMRVCVRVCVCVSLCVYLVVRGCVMCVIMCAVVCSCVSVANTCGARRMGATISRSECAPSVARSPRTAIIISTHDKVTASSARVPISSSSSAISSITAHTDWRRVKRATSLPLVQHLGHSAMLVVMPRWYHCPTSIPTAV